ncbi:MAG TPA: hypothetical protein EYH12_04170 [Psychromonas hadalis]|nr:hypothetical protein [Psychromonas hadalis]
MKIRNLLLIAALPFALTACGGSGGTPSASDKAAEAPATALEGTWVLQTSQGDEDQNKNQTNIDVVYTKMVGREEMELCRL